MIEETTPVQNPNFRPWNMELNTFCMLMHLSRFAGAVFPFAGIVMPIVMWATHKDQNEVIDAHGKNILNWIISSVIYGIICAILIFIVVGIIGLIALGICSLVFTIIGAVRANNGIIYEYPLAIRFLH